MPAGLDAGTAFVTILPNTSKFAPALQGEVQGAVSKTQSRLNAFKGAAVFALGAASVAAVKFGVNSVHAYQESQRVLAQLQNTISHTSGYTAGATAAFQKQATALQNLTGYEDEQILAADTALVRFKLTQQQVQQLIPLILDYARATGTDATSAAENIGKALLGNTRALKTIGIQFKATGDRSKDLATIMDALRTRVGGAAEAFGKTSQGQIEIFKARLNDLQETIGKALLPIVDAMVKGLQIALNVFNKLPGPIKAAVPVTIALGAAFVGLGLAIGIVRKALGGFGVDLAKTTAQTTAATAETDAAAASTTTWGTGLAANLPIIGAVGAALAGMAADQALQAKATEEHAKGNTLLGKTFYALGRFLDPVANALGITGNEAQDVSDSILNLDESVRTMHGDLNSTPALAERAGRALNDMGHEFTQVDKFMGMSMGAFRNWRISTRDAVNGVKGSLDELAGKAHLTAGEIIKSFTKQLTAMSHYRSNWEILLSRNLPQDLAMQLQSMGLKGASIVAALAHANQAQFNKIVGAWRHARDEAAATTGAIKGIGRAAEAVAGNYNITFTVKTNGGPPVFRHGAGGVFARYGEGTTFLGPHGPFIAGEASYPTPLGTGGEVVTNSGVEPLANDHLQRIAAFEVAAMAPVLKRAFKEAVWEMRGAGGGEVTLRAKGRDLVAVIRQEELIRR